MITTCAYCGVGCSFKAEMQGNEVVRMVPYKDGKANHGHSCVKGRFAWGYATHKDRITQADDPRQDHRPLARSELGRGDRLRRQRVQAHPGEVRPRLDRRHHLVALHQRRDLPGAEAGARRLRQQQRRHLRARLPLADRLRPEDRRSAPPPARRTSIRSTTPTSSWSSAPTRPTRHPVFASQHEAAPARGRPADRRRPAPRSTSCARRTSRPTITCRCCPAPTSP